MAMFNAWCDRMPVVVLGATGPVDAVKRRPWIDWIHTARDQGALIREYTKWDDQPASPGAAREAILRGTWIANTVPHGPVYINFDAELQEMKISEQLPPIEVARYMPNVSTAAPAEVVREAAAMLKGAKQVLILAGRASRDLDAWNARVALAEALNARVVTDLKIGATFPTDHPLYVGSPRAINPESVEGLKNVDVVLSLDWVDLAGALRYFGPTPSAKVIQVSLDHRIHNGWSMDHQALPPVDLLAFGRSRSRGAGTGQGSRQEQSAKPHAMPSPRKISDKEPAGFTNEHIARNLRKVLGDRPVTYTHLPLSWDDSWVTFRHPLDYVGSDGGGGVGGGPGISVGAALALKGTGRLPIAICGDGDFLMGVTAVWTAVHYKIPLLFVLANNRSFYNDELHQERMARARNRPVENKWIGQRMSDPEVDLAAMGRAQGAVGFGPVTKPGDLAGDSRKGHRRGRCRPGRRRRCARRARLYGGHDGSDDARRQLIKRPTLPRRDEDGSIFGALRLLHGPPAIPDGRLGDGLGGRGGFPRAARARASTDAKTRREADRRASPLHAAGLHEGGA